MSKSERLGWVAAGTLAIAALFAAGPAAAAPSYNHYAPDHLRSCWHYSYRVEHWVNFCRTYSYRSVDPRYELVYPNHRYYPYHYQPPYGANGPYYGQEPYNGYESALGFSF
jgi:hypothetical protein